MQILGRVCHKALARPHPSAAPLARDRFGAHSILRSAFVHSHTAGLRIQNSREFKYKMQPQDVSAVSHEQAPIVVDLAVAIEVDAAPADGSEAKKNRKKKQKPVTSAETENGAQTQVSTIKKPKVKTTKKQKKAEREAAEEAAAESAQISEPTESAGTTEVAV